MDWHQHFHDLARDTLGQLRRSEDALLWLRGEESAFVRFNHGRYRQPGMVEQAELRLRLIEGERHALAELTLSGDPREDRGRVGAALAELRALLPELPPDPHLLWETAGSSTEHVAPGEPPNALEIAAAVVREAHGLDLVGVLVSGRQFAGLASSRGQRNWDARHSYLVDWCLVHAGDKAVKSTVGGTTWDEAAFVERMTAARSSLAALARPPRRLAPGRYRVFLSPAAVAEFFELMAWNSFGLCAVRTRTTGLLRLSTGEAALSPLVNLAEDTRGGLGPAFNADGFLKPDRVPLVEGGRLVGALVSPRSSREYGVPTNGADEAETPSALALAPGDIPADQALARLGTGLYVSNLWYLNWSDRPAGRVTGMTRFATMWVEDGQLVAPAEVMRFDDTIYHLFGSGLEGLTDTQVLRPSTDTYERRSTASMRLAGALVDGMTLTL